jgi:CubicO group peptidase (beta-lactamase class C family)
MRRLTITFLIILACFSFKSKSYSQNTFFYKPLDLDSWVDSEFNRGIEGYNIPGACFVLIQGDSVRHINGYGVTDIETTTPVNFDSSIFRIGSISKTVVATAAMKLYEDRKLKLEVDINHYLKSFQIDYKFNDSITVENLLTHTSGLDWRNIGWVVANEKDVIPLSEYFKKRMPPQIRPAGKVITYSNHGMGLLALVVEEVSGMPFYEYVEKEITIPLNMYSSGFKEKKELENHYVSNYLQKDGKLIPSAPVYMLNYPTGSFYSTASDMGKYISMFLNYGKFQGVRVLDSTTVVKMFRTAFKQYDEAVYGRPLGFDEMYWNGYKIIWHAGEYQGFLSYLMMIPEINSGFFLSINSSNMTNRYSPGMNFIQSTTNNLLEKLIPYSPDKKNVSYNQPKTGAVDEPLEAFAGTYRTTIYIAQNTLDKIAVLLGFMNEIKIVAKDSILEIVGWVDEYRPVSDLKFQSNYGKYIAFGRNAKGEISYFFDNATSYQKLMWYESIKFQRYWLETIVSVLLIFIIASIAGRLFFGSNKSPLIRKVNLSIASFIILFCALFALNLVIIEPSELFYGIPLLLKIALVIPFLIIFLELFSTYLLIKAIRCKELSVFNLVCHSIVLLTGLAFIPLLMTYNLIGYNY